MSRGKIKYYLETDLIAFVKKGKVFSLEELSNNVNLNTKPNQR